MRGLRLGRIFGFVIRVDFSWFVVFFLILWTFAIGIFPRSQPGWSDLSYLLMGVGITILFFASLLVHELSHSLVARSKGIPVDDITLFLFGGVAHTRAEATEPRDEFAIAAAGPLASLLLTLLLGALYFAGLQLDFGQRILLLLRYGAILNAAVTVFNLLPGFPLDGGRLFRALVWRVTGDFTRATRIATLAGTALGYALVVLGVWRAFTGGPIGGLWLIFVGWFLRNAAVSSYRQQVLSDLLKGARAAQIMSREPSTLREDVSLDVAFRDHFLRERFTAYPVARNGTALGVITLQQVKNIPSSDWNARTVVEAMTPISTEWMVRPSDSLTRVLDGLRSSPAHRVLVLDNERLVGIITASDVTNWLEHARDRDA